MTYLDGNVLAGPLSEIFSVDVTAAFGRCVACGQTNPVARLHVYTDCPGLIARCPGCQHVVLRIVRSPESVWLDMRGCAALSIAL